MDNPSFKGLRKYSSHSNPPAMVDESSDNATFKPLRKTFSVRDGVKGEDAWWTAYTFSDSHYNTFIEKAASRAPKEIGCAFAASFLVSPIVSIIDKCIVASKGGSFATAVKKASYEMVTQPKAFFGGLSFRLTFAVYFGTYTVANLSELALDMKKVRDDESRKKVKVAASSAANISLLAWRDSVFARVFSNGNAAPKSTPFRTLGLFATRDAATMYATFYLAPRAADHLIYHRGWEKNSAELSMALGIPAISQVITAPLHIHAMDYYNKPTAIALSERWSSIWQEFSTVAGARALRILPAFGVGSFSNNKFRELFIRGEDESKLLQKRMTVFIDKQSRDLTRRLTNLQLSR